MGLAILTKLIALSFKPKSWLDIAKKATKNKIIFSAVALSLVFVSGYIILQQMTIVQVGGVMIFVMALMALSLIPYTNKLLEIGEEISKDLWKKSWLAMILWALLGLWLVISAL